MLPSTNTTKSISSLMFILYRYIIGLGKILLTPQPRPHISLFTPMCYGGTHGQNAIHIDNGPAPSSSDSPSEDDRDMAPAWNVGICDAHCHPTDIMASIDHIDSMKAHCLTIMATRAQDQAMVEDVAENLGVTDRSQIDQRQKRVIPSFGWHPWFSHLVWDDRNSVSGENVDTIEHFRRVLKPSPDDMDFLTALPAPVALTKLLAETERRLEKFPLALVGEVGLDRRFQLPEGPSAMTGDTSMKTGGDEGAYTPGSREGRSLTPYRVQMEHQKLILKAQLQLAARQRRPVSVHSVQAHGVVFDVISDLWKGHENLGKRAMKKRRDNPGAFYDGMQDDSVTATRPKPFPERICLHSYSGPPDALKQYLDPRVPADIYFSFSECVNFSNPASNKAEAVIQIVPENRLLIESDLHCAGDQMDKLLERILKRVCQLRNWDLMEGARILRSNWERFIFG